MTDTENSNTTQNNSVVGGVKKHPAWPDTVKHIAQTFGQKDDSLATVRELPDFRPGDTIKVHTKITEGQKERIQIFEGVVIKRKKNSGLNATFTVRKVSYNVGVERTFLVHSPRVAQVDVVSRGKVRRAKLFYLRPLRGKAARIKPRLRGGRASLTSAIGSAKPMEKVLEAENQNTAE